MERVLSPAEAAEGVQSLAERSVAGELLPEIGASVKLSDAKLRAPLDHEVELGVIIGKGGRGITRARHHEGERAETEAV